MSSTASACAPPPSASLVGWVTATLWGMTGTSSATPSAPAASAGEGPSVSVRVLLYSDNITTRDAVRAAVGRRPARDVEVSAWRECATPAAVIEAVEAGEADVLVLDGEAAKLGGLGLCRQLKSEIHDCPPVLVVTDADGRLKLQDGVSGPIMLVAVTIDAPSQPGERFVTNNATLTFNAPV